MDLNQQNQIRADEWAQMVRLLHPFAPDLQHWSPVETLSILIQRLSASGDADRIKDIEGETKGARHKSMETNKLPITATVGITHTIHCPVVITASCPNGHRQDFDLFRNLVKGRIERGDPMLCVVCHHDLRFGVPPLQPGCECKERVNVKRVGDEAGLTNRATGLMDSV